MNKHIKPEGSKASEDDLQVNVMVTLKGKEATRFLEYKSREFIRANAEAGYKLMFERLTQIESEAAA